MKRKLTIMTGLPTVQEKIASMSTYELIQMTEELQGQFIPLDALIRKTCTELYTNMHNKVESVSVLQMNMLAPQIAYELGQRIKNQTL